VRRDAFGRRARFSVFVAEVDRRVVGYASVIAGYNTDLAAPELWMLDLFVLPRWRSRGIGRALVTEVGREAMRRGLTCLGWGGARRQCPGQALLPTPGRHDRQCARRLAERPRSARAR
jgi:GNAT superfamily N-acetyltransferase